MAQELLDKIAKGETPTAEEIGKYKNICKALNAGIEAWKQDIVKAIPAPVPAEITQLIAELDIYKSQLQDILNCNGQGFLRFGQKKDVLYASTLLGSKELYFEPCLNAEKLDNSKTAALGISKGIILLESLLKPSQNETYAKRDFSCSQGTKANLTFGNGVVPLVLDGVNPPIWKINGTEYICYWNVDPSSVFGFFAKTGVDQLKKNKENINAITLGRLIKFTSYTVTKIEPNSKDCLIKAGQFDPYTQGDYFTDAGLNKLKDKLSAQGATNTEITVKDCTDPSKVAKTVDSTSITAKAGQKGIQIEMCWDGSKWKLAHSFKAGALKIASGFKGSVAEVEAKSNAVADRVKETGLKANSFEDELVYKELDVIQALVEVKEATITLCNEAKVPNKYWNDADSPIKAPTLSGVGDGAIAELKDIPELVGFALQIATEPETAKGLWKGIKGLTPAKVKKMMLGAANDKLAKYSAGGNTMKHEVGKDGVAAAMFIYGAVKNIATNAGKIASLGDDVVEKLDDIAEESLDLISGSVDELAGKSINKFIKENDLKGNFLEYESQTLNISKNKKGNKLNETETQEILNREKAFVEPGDLDEIAGTGSTFKKGTTGGWNKEINKHPLGANKQYISESLNEKYITDGSGRVQELEIKKLDPNPAKANGYQRRKAVIAKGGIADDQGGHLLAARFGGAGEQINLVPMKKSINQAGGSWYQMEQEWANALSQHSGKVENIKIKILDYDANGRPGKFEVTCDINGNEKLFRHLN